MKIGSSQGHNVCMHVYEYLKALVLVEEAVHGGEHHRHRELVRVDEVQRLRHRDEHLV